MPRYFFHLHAGESRANPDNTGHLLPDPDAAREMAQRIARRLLTWNLEPVPWLDYQVHVTDEAGAIVCQLPLTEVVHRTARAEAEVTVGLEAQLPDRVVGSPDRNVTPEAEDEGLLERLDAEMSSLVLESRATVLHGSVSGRSEPTLACVQAMRTDFGRPSSSMQFRTMTATFISVA